MNKSLRQLFTIVVALFVILGMSTTIITAIRANQLNNDPRNTRALYHEYGAPRGAILASDGSVIANPTLRTTRSPTSVPIPPANCTRRSPASSRSANAAGTVSKRRVARCCRANPTSWYGSGSNRCSPARKTRARPSKRPLIRKSSRPPTTVLPTMTARPWPSK